ncbi:class I SAM-dependent methyltransferase [Nocardia sp. BMG51109]|uniref:class I SAM-dependent methyltransferase n=1 Tax=Nocardia sp. BMG51109 TaxID=1056816 RepID=UPI000466C2A8|nr:class I SAM-dependent methyltransferase [Nocardia sp. BMG51109]
MAYEHPLAYVLGLEGIALLRAFAGEHDRDFVDARIAEIRRVLADHAFEGVDVEHLSTVDGYRIWSATYDNPDNPAFDFDEGIVRAVAGTVPHGVALDAACGTGRVAAMLADCGHRVIGVDNSAEMLAHAEKRLPRADFRPGELQQLPVETDGVDVVVCSLALTHVPDLAPVFGEFARVLRPGGHLVIADIHPEQVARSRVPAIRGADGAAGRVRSYHHRTGDYVRAGIDAGLAIRSCDEPVTASPLRDRTADPGPWEAWPWSLDLLAPEAAHAAHLGVPSMILWHWQAPATTALDSANASTRRRPGPRRSTM